jgi:simple sugar transport system substrate-binding protein/ribose transport system substrate-binding protein
MLEGDLASINGLDRKNGFLNCMKKSYPNLKVVEYATKWDTPTAVNDAKTALSTYSDLKGIYAHWSGPVPGIIAAEKAAGKLTKVGSPNHIILFSNDGTPQEHGWIRAGQEDGTISQPANLYAQYAVYYAKQALNVLVLRNTSTFWIDAANGAIILIALGLARLIANVRL